MRVGTPRLDFIVVGAQKAGTTSLWRYLEDNDGLRMPPHKEAPFFSEPAYPDQLRPYMRALFKGAPRRAKLGTVTPTYMHGAPGVGVPEIAQRIAVTFPDVRLVALLRDPVERAASAHRMAVRWSGERRSLGQAVDELLEPAALRAARSGTGQTMSYVVAGEYGRMLAAYTEALPREQLLVELSSDLELDPASVVRRVCVFLGVEPHEPARVGERYFRSGGERVSPAARSELFAYLDRHVWPRVRNAPQHRDAFEAWFRFWDTVPGEAPATGGSDGAARLRAHYIEDAAVLERVTGVRPPWLAAWASSTA